MSVLVRPHRERVIGFFSAHGRDDQLPARLPARKDNPNLPGMMTSFSVWEIQQPQWTYKNLPHLGFVLRDDFFQGPIWGRFKGTRTDFQKMVVSLPDGSHVFEHGLSSAWIRVENAIRIVIRTFYTPLVGLDTPLPQYPSSTKFFEPKSSPDLVVRSVMYAQKLVHLLAAELAYAVLLNRNVKDSDYVSYFIQHGAPASRAYQEFWLLELFSSPPLDITVGERAGYILDLDNMRHPDQFVRYPPCVPCFIPFAIACRDHFPPTLVKIPKGTFSCNIQQTDAMNQLSVKLDRFFSLGEAPPSPNQSGRTHDEISGDPPDIVSTTFGQESIANDCNQPVGIDASLSLFHAGDPAAFAKHRYGFILPCPSSRTHKNLWKVVFSVPEVQTCHDSDIREIVSLLTFHPKQDLYGKLDLVTGFVPRYPIRIQRLEACFLVEFGSNEFEWRMGVVRASDVVLALRQGWTNSQYDTAEKFLFYGIPFYMLRPKPTLSILLPISLLGLGTNSPDLSDYRLYEEFREYLFDSFRGQVAGRSGGIVARLWRQSPSKYPQRAKDILYSDDQAFAATVNVGSLYDQVLTETLADAICGCYASQGEWLFICLIHCLII